MDKIRSADSGFLNYFGSPLGGVSFGAEPAESGVAYVVAIKNKRVTVLPKRAAGGGRKWRFCKIRNFGPSDAQRECIDAFYILDHN